MTDIEEIGNVVEIIRKAWPSTSPNDNTFSADQVIEAYRMGAEKYIERLSTSLRKLLGDNVQRVAAARASLLDCMKTLNIHARRAYLRIDNYDAFRILFIVPEQEYCSETFLKVLSHSASLENQARTHDAYSLWIDFVSVKNDNDLDEEQIGSDGYFWPQNLAATQTR